MGNVDDNICGHGRIVSGGWKKEKQPLARLLEMTQIVL